MGTWIRIATSTAAGPVCIAVTVVGLYLSYLAWRRKGVRSGLRGAAWSLLPAIAWLTDSVHLIGSIGSAIVQFAQGFVFSPKTWIGVVLVAVAVGLFLVTGGIPMLQRGSKRKKAVAASEPAAEGRGKEKAAIAPVSKQAPAAASGGDDLSDVEDILRRHGIS
jgi:hypothetical protein